jgi:hypothetical protein
MTHSLPRIATRIAASAALAFAVLAARPAKAWVVFGLPPVVIGPPVVPYAPYPPAYYYGPGYYPPPYGYAPPTAAGPAPPVTQQPAQPQMSQANTPYGTMCYAGVYTCAAPYAAHVGTTCACAGIGAPSYGTVR